MAKGRKTREKKDKPKKGFWASFFEPVDDEFDDDDDVLADEEPEFDDEPEEEDEPERKPPRKRKDKKNKEKTKKKKRADDTGIRLFDDDDDAEDGDDDAFSDEADLLAVDRLTWDDGEPVVDNPYALSGANTGADPGEADVAAPEEIRLFDDDDDEAPRRRHRAGRTRIFKTGAGTTARVHINETETSLRVEEAARKRRRREAERKHAEFVAKQKKRKRRRRMMREMLGNAAFVLFLVVAVALALYYSFLLSDIMISGNDAYTTEYITSLSGLQMGRHMLACDLDAAKAGIEDNPYLQVDSITYIFPSRIRIAITEREEVAGIIGLDYNVIIDHNGYVLSMSGGTDLSDLVQVSGISMTGFQLGQRLGESDDFSTATLIMLMGKLEEYQLLPSIASIDMTTPLAITMITRSGLKVHVGQPTELDSKFVSLYRLMPRFVSQGINWGTLYLSAKGGTVYSQVDVNALLAQPTQPTVPTDPDDPDAPDNPDDPDAPTGPTPPPSAPPTTEDPFQG